MNISAFCMQDICENIRKIAEFLGRSLTNEEVNSITHHCSFTNMLKSKTVGLSDEATVDGKGNQFFRKGNLVLLCCVHLHTKSMH